MKWCTLCFYDLLDIATCTIAKMFEWSWSRSLSLFRDIRSSDKRLIKQERDRFNSLLYAIVVVQTMWNHSSKEVFFWVRKQGCSSEINSSKEFNSSSEMLLWWFSQVFVSIKLMMTMIRCTNMYTQVYDIPHVIHRMWFNWWPFIFRSFIGIFWPFYEHVTRDIWDCIMTLMSRSIKHKTHYRKKDILCISYDMITSIKAWKVEKLSMIDCFEL